MAESYDRFAPPERGPVNAQHREPEDPPNPKLKDDVPLLASEIPMQRIQADNRLQQAGAEGLMAVAAFLKSKRATPAQLVEALHFIAAADFAALDAEQATKVREALVSCLEHPNGKVRIEAARALQVHGPGSQRTIFLTAIGDPERRVRWAVVRRFSDHPEELDQVQRTILLGYLEADTRDAFNAADIDKDAKLTAREFKGTEAEFSKLDRDHNGSISKEEWISPVPSEVRADVVALLLRLHSKLTPDEKPVGYNPWLPSSDQLDIVTRWQNWNKNLSDKTPEEK
ncbi:MAG: hypothetical protein H6839_06750 [Planctomycetes bacterium]|nr:hypothetical protein [Planctomycetota bacterium]